MKNIHVSIISKTQVVAQLDIGTTSTSVKALPNTDIMLKSKATGKAPKKIKAARKGDDLILSADDSDVTLTIEDYYKTTDVGIYGVQDGGASSYHLNSSNVSYVADTTLPTTYYLGDAVKEVALFNPYLLGALGVGVAGAVVAGSKGGKSEPQTSTLTPTPTPPTPPNANVENVTANASINEGETLNATIKLDNENGNDKLPFSLTGLETDDYNNLAFSNGVTRTGDTLNIPKGVKEFTVSVAIVADNTTEGEQTLTIKAGEKSADVKVVDTSTTPVTPPPPPAPDATVTEVTASNTVNEGETLTATITLDNENGNDKLPFSLTGLETEDYNNLAFSNGVTRTGDTLNIPKGVKEFTVSVVIIADNSTEGEQTLTVTVGNQSTNVKVVDTSTTPPPPKASVQSIDVQGTINESETLTATVKLDNENGNPSVPFTLTGLEAEDYNNLEFSNGVTRTGDTLNIPKGVKEFTVSVAIIADNNTEGEQTLTIKAGEKSADVKVVDTSTTPVTPPPPAPDATVTEVKTKDTANEGEVLTATITLDNENGNSSVPFALTGLEAEDYNNLEFSNGVTKTGDTLNIPKGVKEFTVSVAIVADNNTEGEQTLKLTVGEKSADVKVADTSTTPVTTPEPTAHINNIGGVKEEQEGAMVGALYVKNPEAGDYTYSTNDPRFEIVDGYKLKLKDNVKFDYETETNTTVEITFTNAQGVARTSTHTIDIADISIINVTALTPTVNEGEILTATVTLDDKKGNPSTDFRISGIEQNDYSDLTFTNGVTQNPNGTLNIPKDIESFKISLKLTADKTTEGDQTLLLVVGNRGVEVIISDTSTTPPLDAKVETVKVVDTINESETLTATITLDNENGNPSVPFTLTGLETEDYNNLAFSNGVTRNGDTLNIPKGVKEFTISLNITADNSTEGEQTLTIKAGEKSADVKVIDASTTPPPPNANVENVTANASINEGETLTATVKLDNENGNDKLPFSLTGLETEDYTNLSFSNGVTKTGDTLNIPKGVKEFTVSVVIVADNSTEGEQTLKLTVGEKSADVKVIDTSTTPVTPPPQADIIGTDGNDRLYSTDNKDEVIMGGKGDDDLRGKGGRDTYVFSKGDGFDVIYDRTGSGQQLSAEELQEYNTIRFTDVNFTDIQGIVVNGFTSLGTTIQYGDNDSVTLIEHWLHHDYSKVEFADGTIMTVNELLKAVPQVFLVGTDGDDITNDTVGNDYIVGRKGNDTLREWDGGNNTFRFEKGDGKDVMETYTKNNTIELHEINSTDIAISHNKGKVTIHYGDNDSVTFVPYAVETIKFADTTWTVDEVAEKLGVPYWNNALVYNTPRFRGVDNDNNKEVFFSFATKDFTGDYPNEWSEFTDEQKTITREIFKNLEEFLSIKFTERETTTYDNETIYLQNADMLDPGVAGRGGPNNRGGGNVWVDPTQKSNSDFLMHLIAHELGHVLGLDHPRDYHEGTEEGHSHEKNSHELDEKEDVGSLTIMSYDHNVYEDTFQEFDIAALQYLYGVNPNARATNDTYQVGTVLGSQADKFIWDGNGTDTIDASATTLNAHINLIAGTHSYVGQKSAFITDDNQFTINHGTLIENAIGGRGKDTLIGNHADNTFTGGLGSDTIGFTLLAHNAVGGNGRDTMTDFGVGNVANDGNADIIGLSSLLMDYTGDKSTLSSYLSLAQQGGNSVLSIDRDGAGTAYDMTELLVLQGVNVTLDTLINNGQII